MQTANRCVFTTSDTFATLALQNGMDVKNALRHAGPCVRSHDAGHLHAPRPLDMQHAAARKIDCGIGKAELPDEPAPQAMHPPSSTFSLIWAKSASPERAVSARSTTNCLKGAYPDMDRRQKSTREMCIKSTRARNVREKLKVLIAEMKAELAELKRESGQSLIE